MAAVLKLLCVLWPVAFSRRWRSADRYKHSKHHPTNARHHIFGRLLLARNPRFTLRQPLTSFTRPFSSRRSDLPLASASDVRDGTSLLSYVQAEMRPHSYLLRDPAASERIEEACKSLENSNKKPAFPQDLMVLDGDWKLVYSSALALPTTSLEQVSAFLERLPLAPQNVEERIDVLKRRLVNTVSMAPWPVDNPFSVLPGIGDALNGLESSLITLELDHSFSVDGEGGSTGGRRMAAAGSMVKLSLENIRRTLDRGNDVEQDRDMMNPQVRRSQALAEQASNNFLYDLIPKQSEYDMPGPLAVFAAGTFDTTYVDEQIRISRGADFGPFRELRIFMRADSRGKKVFSSWQEEEDALAAAAAAGKLDGTLASGDRWQEGGLEETEMMDFNDEYNGMPDS